MPKTKRRIWEPANPSKWRPQKGIGHIKTFRIIPSTLSDYFECYLTLYPAIEPWHVDLREFILCSEPTDTLEKNEDGSPKLSGTSLESQHIKDILYFLGFSAYYERRRGHDGYYLTCPTPDTLAQRWKQLKQENSHLPDLSLIQSQDSVDDMTFVKTWLFDGVMYAFNTTEGVHDALIHVIPHLIAMLSAPDTAAFERKMEQCRQPVRNAYDTVLDFEKLKGQTDVNAEELHLIKKMLGLYTDDISASVSEEDCPSHHASFELFLQSMLCGEYYREELLYYEDISRWYPEMRADQLIKNLDFAKQGFIGFCKQAGIDLTEDDMCKDGKAYQRVIGIWTNIKASCKAHHIPSESYGTLFPTHPTPPTDPKEGAAAPAPSRYQSPI